MPFFIFIYFKIISIFILIFPINISTKQNSKIYKNSLKPNEKGMFEKGMIKKRYV